jgi:hypothetical protein
MLPYRYRPPNQSCKEFRLLELLPGRFDEHIAIEILLVVLPEEKEKGEGGRSTLALIFTAGSNAGIEFGNAMWHCEALYREHY